MTAADRHSCAERVYSGARWDFGGHPCGHRGKYEEDGKWWCSKHLPSAIKARRAALDAAYDAERADRDAAERQANETATRLTKVLGVVIRAESVWFNGKAHGHRMVVADPKAALTAKGEQS